MSLLPLPDHPLPPPPVSNAQTTAPFQQMLSAVVGKTSGRNSISLHLCAIAKLQSLTKLEEACRGHGIRNSSLIPSKLISKNSTTWIQEGKKS